MKKDDFTVFIIIVIIRQWDERGMEWRYQSAASISDLPQNGLCLSFGHHSKSFMGLLTVLCVKLPHNHFHKRHLPTYIIISIANFAPGTQELFLWWFLSLYFGCTASTVYTGDQITRSQHEEKKHHHDHQKHNQGLGSHAQL